MMDNSVPTYSFGGFLGAGKTTLINHLLRQADGRRFVVFVNDFGALNIDYDLIETVEADRIALSNGCVCCSLNDDLVQSMVEFCRSDPPDAFMIEASGVANPRALDASLQALAQAGLAHAQSRVYVLDADQFGGLDYADTEDLVDHAAASDLVVVNKSDLVDSERMSEITALLARSAPRVNLHKTSYGQLSFACIEPAGLKVASDAAPFCETVNAEAFETYSFDGIPLLSQTRLNDLADALKTMCLRAKGVVRLAEEPDTAFQVQLVGQRLDVRPLEISSDRSSRLVAIGWLDTIDPNILENLLGIDPISSSPHDHHA
ncbi:CobW family GTP-binding protein [Cognatishimia maritima]|uniref:GTPase, G3E family n=1 Tax=Cognatishimia maritima TaxID=870908 RepID=A0A1M5LDH1_9RHOB|nr:GTP-binding protein [Cognatishimia maritima]SHG63067.1 GTPase, G3E family [Cognatishimia maritima]